MEQLARRVVEVEVEVAVPESGESAKAGEVVPALRALPVVKLLPVVNPLDGIPWPSFVRGRTFRVHQYLQRRPLVPPECLECPAHLAMAAWALHLPRYRHRQPAGRPRVLRRCPAVGTPSCSSVRLVRPAEGPAEWLQVEVACQALVRVDPPPS